MHLLALFLMMTLAAVAHAQDTVVIGAIIEVTGKSALAGQQERRG